MKPRERDDRWATARVRLVERLFSERSRFVAAAAFLAFAFLLGGGSRDDIISLIFLRPIAIVAIGYSLYRRNPGWLKRLGPPFWLMVGLLLWAVIQAVPLPYSIWSNLPGRNLIAANDAAMGLGHLSREISLVPSRTMNTLFALSVPFAMMLMAANLDAGRVNRLLWIIYAALVMNALAAAAQMLGPSSGSFYFFRITSLNSPVGLFANRNHFAIFFASLVPLLAHAAMAGDAHKNRHFATAMLGIAGLLGVILIVLLTGSRAGVILCGAALCASALIWFATQRDRTRSRKMTWGIPLAGGAFIAITAAAVLGTSRATTLNRFFEESMTNDLRFQVLPQLKQMLFAFFPVGSGFGSFQYAYHMFEPASVLRTAYLNHAHNDMLQFLIEGGLVAGVLMIAFAAWFIREGLRAARLVAESRARHVVPARDAFVWLSMALLLAGSIGDYPLRTPALMAYAVLLCGILHRRVAERTT